MDIERLFRAGPIVNQRLEPRRLLAQLGIEASFAYSSVKDGQFQGMIAGQWFRSLEKYVDQTYKSALTKRVVFQPLAQGGIWGAFYATEVGLLNAGSLDTAEALIGVALTEAGQYGIPTLLEVAEYSRIFPILPALGFEEIWDDTERYKKLFVNKYRS